MLGTNLRITGLPCRPAMQPGMVLSLAIFFLLLLNCRDLPAAEPMAAPSMTATPVATTNNTPGYNVQAYVIQGKPLLATNILAPLFSKYTGTNVSGEEIIRAASDLQTEYRNQGYLMMNIVIAPRRITNGIVTMDAFPGKVAQILLAGKRYLVSYNGAETVLNPPLTAPALAGKTSVAGTSPTTNAVPRFTVEKYLVTGNTVMTPQAVANSFTNANGAFGTNVSFDGIRSAVSELQGAYRERGYFTVSVGLPAQKLTNATVKVQVTEGRLAAIDVTGNRYFSSNNVMRTLPSLHTNIILNRLIFEAELNRANANQDRQIYPLIGPGPDPGTSDLTLKVKDRLPLHAKMDLDNQNSPGTPELRVNSSAVYDNLWQREHSLGIQYGFSPEAYKTGKQWNLYDLPLVANYSTFYRLPLGNPEPIEDVIAGSPGRFGYNEATRKFDLPPPSGQADLTFFASRSTIDTGLSVSPPVDQGPPALGTNADQTVITNTVLTKAQSHQDLTVNNDLGFRLNLPLPTLANFHQSMSGGLDFKSYELTSTGTNIFSFFVTEYGDPDGNPLRSYTVPTLSGGNIPLPLTISKMEYMPLSLRYDAGWHDFLGPVSIGLGLNANLWYSAHYQTIVSGTNTLDAQGVQAVRLIANSQKASGHWVVLNPSFSHQFEPFTNWITTLRADGQWTSEPLISNEQFGAGGVNSVRGYHEGEVFGDTGWHVSLEQQTAPYVVGPAYGNVPLTVRGSVYMDYATVYLLDPQGRPGSTALWGTGFGGVASIGSHWETRMLFSLPLLNGGSTEAMHPFFNFMLTAQF